MGTIQVSKDASQILSFLNDRVSDLPDKGSELIQDVTDTFGGIAQIEAPFLLGGLRDSIFTEIQGMLGIVNSELNYFPYVILGTEPHSIGSSVYMYGVWRYIGLSPLGNGNIHPGTSPNDFMQSAVDSGDSMVDDKLNEFGTWLTGD